MCGIGFTADITHDTPTATASLTNFVYGNSKTVARRHSAPDDRRAVRAHDHAVIRPASRGEVERTSADMGFELGRTAEMRETERFRVDGAASNENGQATSCPAVSVESGVNVDHQALPQ
jgi:hypothetical protein